MKKILTLLPLVVGAALYVVLSGNSTGPGLSSGMERTGVTGMSGCGGACHTSPTGSSISDTIRLMQGSASVTNYVPGHSYMVHISAANTSTSSLVILPRFGFQLTAVKSGTYVNAGTFVAPAGTHTVTPVAGVLVVEHSNAHMPTTGTGATGTTYTIDIPWTAPIAGTGSITFSDAVNSVNYDSTNGGDVYNTASLVVHEGALETSETNANAGQLSLYPNPTNGLFTLKIESPVAERVHVVITNISGQRVKELDMNTNEISAVSLNQPAGIYFVSAATLLQSYFRQIEVR